MPSTSILLSGTLEFSYHAIRKFKLTQAKKKKKKEIIERRYSDVLAGSAGQYLSLIIYEKTSPENFVPQMS